MVCSDDGVCRLTNMEVDRLVWNIGDAQLGGGDHGVTSGFREGLGNWCKT